MNPHTAMKHVNLSPDLEKKKEEIMKKFREEEESPAAPPTPPDVAQVEDSPPAEEDLEARVIESLKNIYDPEIPVNIYDLGLIYRVEIVDNFARIEMTLTTPGCPVAQTFPGMVEGAVKQVPGIADAMVDLVWDPPWSQAFISEAARLELGLI